MTEIPYANRHPGDFPTRAKSNQSEPLVIPQGRVHYSENGTFGVQSAEMMAGFCSVVELLLIDWRRTNDIVMTPGADRRSAFLWCEAVEAKLEGMLDTVTMLGIKPLEVWLSGRLEQEDI